MWFKSAEIHVHETAATVAKQCPNCENTTDFKVLWNKAGFGLGIPVVSWFTDKTTITTHKHYHLGCPTCGYAERIEKSVALGLIAKGEKN